jgi:predicted amino acid dehydrogenase
VADAQIVVGAGPTGASLPAEAVAPGAVLIDVAIPDTLVGTPAPGVRVLAGEAVVPPPGWRAGGWGRLYQVFAGYGPTQVYACLIEPLVVAVAGRSEPFAQGRRLKADTVVAFGEAAEALGFHPRLAQGWRGVPSRRLRGRRRRRDRLRAALVRGRGR